MVAIIVYFLLTLSSPAATLPPNGKIRQEEEKTERTGEICAPAAKITQIFFSFIVQGNHTTIR
jgi:hypothetical protein